MSPVRILFIDHATVLGGAEHSLLIILRNLDRKKWHPILVGTYGKVIEKAETMGLETYPITFPKLRNSPWSLIDWPSGIWNITWIARQLEVSCIYANTIRSALYAAPAARLARSPFIWHMRDLWVSESRPRFRCGDQLIKWFLCRLSTRVITNSEAVARYLPKRCKPVVIHNSVQLDQFDPALEGKPFRAKYRIPDDTYVVGTIGRLRPWKGQDRFLRAMSQVAKVFSKVYFLIVGGSIFDVKDSYDERLLRLSRELGIEDRVTFTGHLEDVRPALAAMDVFVHAGDPEPFGLVNIEAMAMAKPVVAFAHGALPEIVVDGETGLLISPEDESEMAHAVQALLSDPNRRRAMGSSGRKRAETHFSSQRMVSKIEALLVEIAKERVPLE